jgi:hypothetical protein
MSHRTLSNSEITALQNQGCFSSDWSKIQVSDPFSTDHVHQVRFVGTVKIGELGGAIETGAGEGSTSGLYNCKIENCEIGNKVLLDNVQEVKNYKIADAVIIKNVQSIAVNETSSFGNGHEIEVLNEGGGRELKIFDRLSSQLAYMLVSYRHDDGLIKALNGMIDKYASDCSSAAGSIGKGASILNSGTIAEVNIGEDAVIHGASLLKNGTIASTREAPAKVGQDVIAKNFIILSGSKVDSGALVDSTFVGQGVSMGKQFSAEGCVFFANSEAFHGEAVSVFAGPYTVTHHKSSLLIAGMYSFYNAGSGTNQSNHMYKLGPVHQGILERGSKTGSFAYLLWPCRIGAFSVVMGKNVASFDTSDFPFSYINVDNEKSILTPGMNMFTVGTKRDTEKWPNRDKRKDPVKYDLINFDFLSPYIIQRVLTALDTLQGLYEKASKKQETVFHKGIRIKRLMLKSTRKYYDMAVGIFLGEQLQKRLALMAGAPTMDAVKKALKPVDGPVPENWLDLSGMIASEQAILQLQKDIAGGTLKNLEQISAALEEIHGSYEEQAWLWTTRILEARLGVDVADITAEQLLELVDRWESETIKLDKMILADASKEFDNSSKLGFGLDGDEEVRDKDFEAVRGIMDENKFIVGVHAEMKETEEKADELRKMIQGL